jgi:hypothetical protein
MATHVFKRHNPACPGCLFAALGSSRASSVSTTPARSLSPFHLQQTTNRNTASHNQQQQQQQVPAASAFPPPPQQQQQQHPQAVTPGLGAGVSPSPGTTTLETMTSLEAMRSMCSALADVVIMDGEGAMLHYQAPVEHAAAAAAQGRVPVGSIGSGGLHVYAPHSRGSQRSSRHSFTSGSGSLQPHQQPEQLAPGRLESRWLLSPSGPSLHCRLSLTVALTWCIEHQHAILCFRPPHRHTASALVL